MFAETQTMKDLHKIREELYNETRCMNPEERIAYLNNEAENVRHLIRASSAAKRLHKGVWYQTTSITSG